MKNVKAMITVFGAIVLASSAIAVTAPTGPPNLANINPPSAATVASQAAAEIAASFTKEFADGQKKLDTLLIQSGFAAGALKYEDLPGDLTNAQQVQDAVMKKLNPASGGSASGSAPANAAKPPPVPIEVKRAQDAALAIAMAFAKEAKQDARGQAKLDKVWTGLIKKGYVPPGTPNPVQYEDSQKDLRNEAKIYAALIAKLNKIYDPKPPPPISVNF